MRTIALNTLCCAALAGAAELPHAAGQHSDPCGWRGAPAAAHPQVRFATRFVKGLLGGYLDLSRMVYTDTKVAGARGTRVSFNPRQMHASQSTISMVLSKVSKGGACR